MIRTVTFCTMIVLVAGTAFVPRLAYADVLPPPASEDDLVTFALSIEAIGALERPLTGNTSVSVWGGGGTVFSLSEPSVSLGGEIAVELRAYGNQSHYFGSNVGLYLGSGLFHSDSRDYITITPGVKLSYTMGLPQPLVEPYLGISYPLIRNLDGGEWEFVDTLIVTLGIRVVFRAMRP